MVRDQAGAPLANAIVWASPLRQSLPTPSRPDPAAIEQRNLTFLPPLIVVLVGARVDFRNHDTVYHNIYSLSKGNRFNLGLYKPGETRSIVLNTPGVVKVFCNIHDVMRATVVVLDTPYFTMTDRDGAYTLPALPSGSYRLHVWHRDRFGAPRQIDVHNAEARRVDWVLPESEKSGKESRR
jgi:plastocyanin